MRVVRLLLPLLAALSAAGGAHAATAPPWQAAAQVRTGLANAQLALIMRPDRAEADAREAAAGGAELGRAFRTGAPGAATRLERALAGAAAAVRARDETRLNAARADAWTAVLLGAYRKTLAAVSDGEVAEARKWLLVREYRPPTLFSRAGADATLALAALRQRPGVRADALASVRADLLDTYGGRLRGALEDLDTAIELRYPGRAAAAAALARGYFQILHGGYAAQRGPVSAAAAAASFERLAAAALAADGAALADARGAVGKALVGFRAAPLSPAEEVRRAGQVLRFLSLVPVEYGRGVHDGRVTLAFEVQEAITFRDGAAQAFGDLEPGLLSRDAAATARLRTTIARLGADLGAAARGTTVADPADVKARTEAALAVAERLFPEEWQESAATADFDVIRATLDRVEGAIAAGRHGDAEQARIEAYAVFEFGPEQRLRGLAPSLFTRVEGLFWYGADGKDGLAEVVKRRASPAAVAETRAALDAALRDAEAAVGAGPSSRYAVVSNTAVIVFREGLEGVLILAALVAGLVGGQRQFRRPLFLGAAAALVASALTWVVAQTVLGSLSRYGEKLEAVVSLVAIGVLLVILNWFYHRIYWNEHLAGLHGRKKQIMRAGAVGAIGAQTLALVALGFSSVYRECFETVLFLQALVLEAGVADVLLGVAIGLVGVAAVGVLTIALGRKLPHKRLLVVTGALILFVLVVMVGTTVQTLQVVGWVPVSPVEGLTLPYWAGLWLGLFPTWQGLVAQATALVLVLGSYVLAEQLRGRRRARRLAAFDLPTPASARAESRERELV